MYPSPYYVHTPMYNPANICPVHMLCQVEEGQGLVRMGDSRDRLDFQANVRDDCVIIIPAGKWHNLINMGSRPLKLYSIYAPPQHPYGTIHVTKEDAEEHHAL